MGRASFIAFVAASVASITPARAADDDVKAGARVYQDNCETCHGEGLHNNSGVTFDLRRLHADEHDRFVNSVLNGKNAMPAWRGALDAGEIEQLWAISAPTPTMPPRSNKRVTARNLVGSFE